MVMEFFRSRDDEGFELVETQIAQMLSDGRHCFDAASNALLAGTDASIVGPDIRATDRRINETEQEVRRSLVVHASVHGAAADVALILKYMNVVKDIERVGDYAKNIFDLAAQGATFQESSDTAELVAYRDSVSLLIANTSRVFGERDTEQARKLVTEGDRLLDEFDEHVRELVESDIPARMGVPRALFYRYMKRIAAHLMNVLSAVVMPVDRLDYYDENQEDRAEEPA